MEVIKMEVERGFCMKKIMISLPMAGRDESHIRWEMNQHMIDLARHGYTVVNTLFSDIEEERLGRIGVINKPLYYMGMSVDVMSKCDAVFFCKGWENARGCRIEHLIAEEYGLEVLYEK